jgi:hypothetical protein
LPAWVLVAKPADWRWLTEGDLSPWYPTVHIFRQSAAGDWTPVIEQIRNRLAIAAAR